MKNHLLSDDELKAINEALSEEAASNARSGLDRRVRIRLRMICLGLLMAYYLVMIFGFPDRIMENFDLGASTLLQGNFRELVVMRVTMMLALLLTYFLSFWTQKYFVPVSLITLIIASVSFGFDFNNFYLFARPEAYPRVSMLIVARLGALYFLLANVIDAMETKALFERAIRR